MMRNINFDPYETLGINHNATQNEIRKAYQKLALKHHPDRRHNQNQNSNNSSSSNSNTGEGSGENGSSSNSSNYGVVQQEEKHEEQSGEDKMARINEAYSILKDEEQKKQFDLFYRCGGLQVNENSDFRGGGERRGGAASEGQFRHPSHMRRKNDRPSPFANDPFFQPSTYGPRHVNVARGHGSSRGGGTSFTFTSTSNEYNRETDERIRKRTTTSFRNGTKYVEVETFTVRRDGTSERHITTRTEENATVMGHFVKSMFGLNNKEENNSTNSNPTRRAANEEMNNSQRSMESKKAPWFENVFSQIRKCVG